MAAPDHHRLPHTKRVDLSDFRIGRRAVHLHAFLNGEDRSKGRKQQIVCRRDSDERNAFSDLEAFVRHNHFLSRTAVAIARTYCDCFTDQAGFARPCILPAGKDWAEVSDVFHL